MGPNITIRQLEYLLAVAKHRSIAAAALEVHVSAVAVGAALTELERNFDTPLLVRERSKGISLTPEGEAVVTQAREILQRVAALPSVANAHSAQRGPLRIGVFGAMAALSIPAIVRHYAQSHPPQPLSFKEGPLDELSTQLNHGELDVIVGFLNQLSPGLKALPLLRVSPGLIVPQSHPFAQRSSIRLAELADESLILLSLEPAYTIIRRLLEAYGLGDVVKGSYANVETIKSVVATGQSVALLYSIGPELHNTEGNVLRVVEIEDLQLDNAVAIMLPDYLSPPPFINDLAAALRTISFGSPQIRPIAPEDYQWVRRPLN